MNLQRLMTLNCLICVVGWTALGQADDGKRLQLSEAQRKKCYRVLLDGLHDEDFWPSIHAAEGLTLGGHGDVVRKFLEPKLPLETDDQKRCGLARELVRAGDRRYAEVMFRILDGKDPHGHIHAAESLYKVRELNDGVAMRAAFAQDANLKQKLMAAGALGRAGNRPAMQYLRDTLNHEDPEIYKIAAWVLGRVGDKSDIPRLRAILPRCPDELARCYVENSLAALGAADGLQLLQRNLRSQDPAVRTYAATFAGDARAMAVAPRLIEMLDDPHLDARIRAAQTLFVLAGAPQADPAEDLSLLLYEASADHPRYTEGSIVELNDGSLLFAVTEFHGSGSDFARAHIIGRTSLDGGRTWSEPRILQENSGDLNVMSVTLRRSVDADLKETISLYYLQKNSHSDLDLYVRHSKDGGKTFGAPILVTDSPGYHVVNNDRITRLSTGRLLAPAASTPDVRTVNHFTSRCYLSDDNGLTWRTGQGAVDAAKRGAMEPEVVELSDGRVLMIVRNQLGYIGKAYSSDGGETWTEPESLGVQAPEAPATLRRVPSTGDLLLVWNNTFQEGAGHGGKRTPLTAAISSDDGQTWKIVGNLESDATKTFAYTSLTFVQDRMVLSYWESGPASGQLSCRFRSLPVSWLYENR